ncbi:hypothetical protein KL864_27225 [Mycolicibacterium goodii]|uniref:hypothetical protein n=1 Tax=Mycolicibacterium goodii TaxID=134601 RepID=UPI001BDBE387|nr:hypothetical protein [Mycolicibacterium goodii]MBU8819583.1 hypothetical protein [Mycolicibacterium goodii]
MSESAQGYANAASLLEGLVDELASKGNVVDSGNQWVARLRDRARKLAEEEMAREATVQQIARLAIEFGLRSESGDHDTIRAFARYLFQHFEIEPVEVKP